MKVPSIVARKALGRADFSTSRIQDGGTEFKVPYVKQSHVNMCGDACVEMLSRYYDWGLNINMARNTRGITDGLTGAEALQRLGDKGCRGYAARLGDLKNLLTRRGPLMCGGAFAHMGVLGTQGHWIIIKGMDATHFWTHDPWHGANVKVEMGYLMSALDPNAYEDPSIICANVQ